jgi:hypothetical protein
MVDSVFMESWQGYPTNTGQASDGLTSVWVAQQDGGHLTFVAGRVTGSRALSMGTYQRLDRLIPQSATFNLRFAVRFDSDLNVYGGVPFGPNFDANGRFSGVSLKSAAAQLPMFYAGHDTLGRPLVIVGGVQVPQPVDSPQFQKGRFHHCEFVGKCATVANGGYLQFNLDGKEVFNASMDYTAWTNTGNTEMNVGTIRVECNAEGYTIQDLIYYPDDTLRGEHTFWSGQINGNSAVSWTPSAGTNYQNINELAADDDTTYNLSNTVGQVDLFTIPTIPATPTSIECVQVGVCWRKDDSGTRQALVKLTDPAGNRDGPDVNLTITYGWHFDAYKTDAAAAGWTKANLANTKPGYQLVA